MSKVPPSPPVHEVAAPQVSAASLDMSPVPTCDMRRSLAPGERVALARRFVGLPCIYELGAGGSLFFLDPRDHENKLDCSGFICWLLGVPRQTANLWYQEFNGGWVSTDAMWHDMRRGAASSLFQSTYPGLGVALVLPRSAAHVHGHVALASEFDEHGLLSKVIHCSLHNPAGAAIAESSAARFLKDEGSMFIAPVPGAFDGG